MRRYEAFEFDYKEKSKFEMWFCIGLNARFLLKSAEKSTTS